MSERSHEVIIEAEQMSPGREGLLIERSNPTPSKPTIFEVDSRLRQVNQKDYEPKIVSIGPIHHGNPLVMSMEQHKMRFLQELLVESKRSREELVKEVSKMEVRARTSYSKSSINDEDRFVEILLLDSCFIIQLIRNYSFRKSRDPILESETLIQIIHDLLLFENQLPFFVLTTLFDMTKTGNPNDDLRRLILFLVEDIVPWFDVSKAQFPHKPDHLLGLVYGCVSTKIPSNPNSNSSPLVKLLELIFKEHWRSSSAKGKKSPVIYISSASDLKEVGGILLRTSEDNSLTFAGRVLRFPPLLVSNETESLLRNLMAYEQLRLGDDHQRHVIDYVFFLHCLARSITDVEILHYDGIIKNYLGSYEQILQMLARLGTNYMRSPDYTYSYVFDGLNRYYSFRRNSWVGSVERTYFNTPWSLPMVSAATLLLVLVSLQTYFVFRSFRKL